MDSWGARVAAVEGSHFRAQEKMAVERHLRKLVDEGRLPPSALDSLLEARPAEGRAPVDPFSGLSTETRGRPQSEVVYQHVKGKIPGQYERSGVRIQGVPPRACLTLNPLDILGITEIYVSVSSRESATRRIHVTRVSLLRVCKRAHLFSRPSIGLSGLAVSVVRICVR